MTHATMTMGGEVFVLVPKREFKRLIESETGPNSPTPDKNGNFEALAYMRASMGTKIISRREAVGLSQKSLAAAASVRVETLNRIEKAKVTPDTATIIKIDKALKRAEAKKRRRS